MRRGIWLWVLAIAITLVAAKWQRDSGPTYPVSGKVTIGGKTITYTLDRSHGGAGDQPVRIEAADPEVRGEIKWRRFPSDAKCASIELVRRGDALEGALPHQPPLGKLEYEVHLRRGEEQIVIPERPAVTRFKGAVSPVVLAPHILLMFLGMLFSNRTGLEALFADGDPRRSTMITLVLLAIGGFVFGPWVVKQAFGLWWTGVPVGWDITDNKTLIAGLAWAWAAWRVRGGRRDRVSVLVAALVTLVVFAIPHSV